MKRLILIVAIAAQGLQVYAQNIVSGMVMDAENNKPVPYVSIGITRTSIGTVSNAGGLFNITLNDKINDNDTLKFSSIGYQSELFLISEINKRLKNGPLTIPLKRSTDQLEQVSVISTHAHTKIAGYDKNSKLFGLGFDAGGIGAQAGVVIPIAHRETNIQNVSFFIIQNPFRHLIFRMNLYEMINDKPGRNILHENIFINVEGNQTGKMIFDLSKYNLYADSDVLLTLEWIEAQPATNAKLAVAAAVFGHTYYRQASQAAWAKKTTAIGLSVKTVY